MTGLVLVAGFAPEMRDAYAKALTNAGMRVTTTAEGVGALVKAVALRPHAVVMALDTPGIAGFNVAQRLQNYAREVPVILIGDGDVAKRALAAGFVVVSTNSAPDVIVAMIQRGPY